VVLKWWCVLGELFLVYCSCSSADKDPYQQLLLDELSQDTNLISSSFPSSPLVSIQIKLIIYTGPGKTSESTKSDSIFSSLQGRSLLPNAAYLGGGASSSHLQSRFLRLTRCSLEPLDWPLVKNIAFYYYRPGLP
jgi:hypothetical protein